jgi:hypothetical protein
MNEYDSYKWNENNWLSAVQERLRCWLPGRLHTAAMRQIVTFPILLIKLLSEIIFTFSDWNELFYKRLGTSLFVMELKTGETLERNKEYV